MSQSAVNLLYIAAIFFGVAAPIGAGMVFLFLRGKKVPMWLASLHGALAATGVILLLVKLFKDGLPTLVMWALGLFVLAALGGLTMEFAFRRKGRRPPTALMLGHGALALTAFALLLVYLLG